MYSCHKLLNITSLLYSNYYLSLIIIILLLFFVIFMNIFYNIHLKIEILIKYIFIKLRTYCFSFVIFLLFIFVDLLSSRVNI